MKLSVKKVLSITIAVATSVSLSVAAPSTSAEEGYVTTDSVSPEGDEYSIGWTTGSNINSQSYESGVVSAQDYSFENFETEDGAQTLIHINNGNAPTVYSFLLNLPEGVEAVPSSDGGYVLLDGDKLIATFRAPWALDGNGNPVDTYIAIENGVLTQTVLHDSNTVFPVVADPQIDWGWSKTTVYLSKEKTRVTGGVTGAGALAALPWMAALGVSGPVGIAILAAAGKISYDAIRAHQHGKCLGIVADISNAPSFNGPVSTFEYTGGNCK